MVYVAAGISGLPGIVGKQPEVIAASVAAQLLLDVSGWRG